MMYKYIVKNVARQNGQTATFMPKPLFGDNGSGMHAHQSLWKGERNLFYDDGRLRRPLRDLAKYYIGGLLKHAPALLALVAPDHQLLSPAGARLRGARQPRLLAAQPLGGLPHPGVLARARRPSASSSARPTRPATRTCPSPPADGRPRRHREPHRSRASRWTRTSTSLPPEEAREVKQVPGSLDAVLDALERDHDFLLEGRRVHERRARDLDRLQAQERGRPHPPAAAPLRVHPVLRRLGREDGEEATMLKRPRIESNNFVGPGTPGATSVVQFARPRAVPMSTEETRKLSDLLEMSQTLGSDLEPEVRPGRRAGDPGRAPRRAQRHHRPARRGHRRAGRRGRRRA